MKRGQFSVVIPAYNAAQLLPRCLDSLANQIRLPAQVIIVDDGSTDQTATIAYTYRRLSCEVIKHGQNRGLAASLASGLAYAHGEFVMFLHADCELVTDDWICRVLSLFEDPEVVWVTGYYEQICRSAHPVERIFAALRGQAGRNPPPHEIEIVHFSEGKCDAFRRRFLYAVGGIPTLTRISGEDQLLAYEARRRGFRILKCWALPVVQHSLNSSAVRSLSANLRKEFIHGKTQSLINIRNLSTILRDAAGPSRARWRGWRSLGKVTYTTASVAASALWGAAHGNWGLTILVLITIARVMYHSAKCLRSEAGLPPIASLVGGFLGLAADGCYTAGIVWGTIVAPLQQLGIIKQPI